MRATRAPRGANRPLQATGVEIDGTVLRVVTVKAGKTKTVRTYAAETTGEAVAGWLKAEKPLRPIRVATSATAAFTAASFPAALPAKVLPQAMAQWADEAFAAEPSTRLTAGIVADAPTEDNLRGALLCIPRIALDDLWPTLRKLKAQVAPSALLLAPDGMHLVTGRSGSSLSLVEDGVLAEHHPCSVGEIDWEDADVLRPSPHAPVQMLVAECAATAQSWARIGHEIPETVFVSGPGAQEPTLVSALRDIGLSPTPRMPPPGIDTTALSPSDRSLAAGALAIAAAPSSPTLWFTDPDAEVVAERSRRATRHQLTAVAAIVVVAGLGASVYGVVQASAQLNRAKAAKAAATAHLATVNRTLATKAKAATLAAEVARIEHASPSFGPYITKMLNAAPAGTTWTGFSVQGSATSLAFQVSATLPGTSFLPISTWVSALEASGATPVTVPSWTASTQGVTVSLSATYPLTTTTPLKAGPTP